MQAVLNVLAAVVLSLRGALFLFDLVPVLGRLATYRSSRTGGTQATTPAPYLCGHGCGGTPG